eukprot:329458_1
MRNLYKHDESWYNEGNNNPKSDTYIIFDMNGIKIDSFDILFEEDEYSKMILVYHTDIYDDENDNNNSFELYAIKRDILQEQKVKIFYKSENKRFVKLCFNNRNKDRIGINSLNWYGYEPQLKDEITDIIKVFQSSNDDGHPNRVLKPDNRSWKGNNGNQDKCFIIFDCYKFEINKIMLEFDDKSKPQILKIKLSHVCNNYSFNKKSMQICTFDTIKSMNDDDWMDIKLFEDINIVNNAYKNGFMRYLKLEFSKYSTRNFSLLNCRFFGVQSEQIPKNSEQFDIMFDNIDEKEEQKQYKPVAIDHSPSDSNFDSNIDDIFHDKGRFIFKVKHAFIIIDLGNNKCNKIIIQQDNSYPCKQYKISTHNQA